ncbi:4-(cytidine 5'-diphospho)-2-C-methyl-D-erythritol kinase [Spongiactinospora sp. TRM90649]|uniref:4-(cytidine 5'-diphospho)-2-C-methyl-D-erythritol kinase n=1 Tax=Spongiactinospora sp. TRM90649 TaxID=3031114 RepID=UPI0023F973C8|nr:4-(cytidine 5'-diphospho)-2-C-methyl-D-erythritol kinase [Spongiactinospora sp. TRM90649]MDF5757715.1 4-(cytidine 5'-diphospho)-2-C-methyl-D-erythritol kinase [Spongiactinospora sp. TRM90649]
MDSVTVRVPAKVNLQLAVGPLRDDGYHDLVNIFHAVSIYDHVTATAAGSFSTEVIGDRSEEVPLGDDNLAIRAARALAERAGRPLAARLTIRKSIPVAGGMAGGSADAAGALVACNELWKLGLSSAELLEIAAGIGSDVPFALFGGTAVGTGRGEKLTGVTTGGRFHWVFALAEGGLSTPAVYGRCDRLRESRGERVGPPRESTALMAAVRDGDADALGAELTNDLQEAAVDLRPSLAATLDAGRERGALGAIVSGSGPTCAFLVASESGADDLRSALTGSAVCRAAVTAHGPVRGALGYEPDAVASGRR